MGTSPDTTSFEFKTMLELKQFLAQYASSEGSQIAVSLFKVEYKWNDSTKKFESSSTALEASDLK